MIKKHPVVLIVDDERDIADLFSDYLAEFDYIVDKACSAREARQKLDTTVYDGIFLDINMPGESGYLLLKHIRDIAPETAVIMVSGIQEIDMVVKCMHAGAFDYIVKPLSDMNQLRVRLSHAVEQKELRKQNKVLKKELASHKEIPDLLSESPVMKRTIQQIHTVAPFNSTVLITGDSGTGKEVVARTIHALSSRAEFPFIPVNCGALSPTLLASTLFGHEKGAFTDAHKQQIGLFEESNGGTILLDEITETDLEFQTQLLRVLEERQIRRVGVSRSIQLDLRILAATNQDIKMLVRKKSFREDLYYRLNVVQVNLPPLRDRMEDIPLIIEYQLGRLESRTGKANLKLHPETMYILNTYSWPGNIRELCNVIEHAVIMSRDNIIHPEDLPRNIFKLKDDNSKTSGGLEDYEQAKTEFEKMYFMDLIRKAQGNMSLAARMAGLSRQHVYLKIRQLGLDQVL